MSGTLNNVQSNVSFALNRHYKVMARLQEQAYSGSRINRVSDDSFGAYRVLGLNSQQELLGSYMNNISEAIYVLEDSTVQIQNMVEAISDTKTGLTQILSGTYTEDNRETFAKQINETLEQMVSLANTKHVGQYIFGGGNTSTVPYAVQRTNGEIQK